MKNFLFIPVFIFLLLPAAQAATAADQRLPPMISGEAMPHLPDTVLPDGMRVGHWSAGDAKTAARAKAPAPAAAPMASQPKDSAKAPRETEVPAQQSMTVTSIQTCYDQLDPADVAEIKSAYLKPYAECHARLEAKLQGKREMKAGEAQAAQTPESPRNYIRVQRSEPAETDSPGKSAGKMNP